MVIHTLKKFCFNYIIHSDLCLFGWSTEILLVDITNYFLWYLDYEEKSRVIDFMF